MERELELLKEMCDDYGAACNQCGCYNESGECYCEIGFDNFSPDKIRQAIKEWQKSKEYKVSFELISVDFEKKESVFRVKEENGEQACAYVVGNSFDSSLIDDVFTIDFGWQHYRANNEEATGFTDACKLFAIALAKFIKTTPIYDSHIKNYGNDNG
ncbi:MAG: hypothetical protein DRQ46_00365 [Gammaproteobacteria bacterium]|nr:MAG: hypothetical protein DRQ46_00365 [Gammaproteobacteria bacterium]